MRRRIQFQPKANIPMAQETFDRLSLQLRMASEALITCPSIDTYNQLSKILAALNRGGMEGGAFELGTDTMNAICDRFQVNGAISVTADEAAQLRTAIFSIEPALPKMPVNRLRKALAEVAIFFAQVGIDDKPNQGNHTHEA